VITQEKEVTGYNKKKISETVILYTWLVKTTWKNLHTLIYIGKFSNITGHSTKTVLYNISNNN
jgi:hypothetical protein